MVAQIKGSTNNTRFKRRKSSLNSINNLLHDYIRDAIIEGRLSKLTSPEDREKFSISDVFLDSLYPKINKNNRKRIIEGRNRCLNLFNIYYKPLICSSRIYLDMVDALLH